MTRRALSWAISEACARVVAGDHQQPARVAVEAMDDARPLDAGDPAVVGSPPGEQRVDQRAVAVAGRRVDDEPGRLVDDQQVVVLVDDLDRDRRVGLEVARDLGRRDLEDHGSAARRSGWPAGGGPASSRAAVGDQLLDVAARQAGRVGHEAVDAPDDLALGDASRRGPGSIDGGPGSRPIDSPRSSAPSRSPSTSTIVAIGVGAEIRRQPSAPHSPTLGTSASTSSRMIATVIAASATLKV